MGAIYLGKKLGSGGFEKEVVLKQLLPEYTARPEFRDLFFREARISATLDHANIVHTFDLVESDQSLFIVMEYVRGADLRTIVRRARQRRRELSPAAAVHIALGILTGLSYAHTRRDAAGNSLDIIHRDVSPSNIICSVQGEAKLSDFGIARASTHSSVFYRVRGKVGYMSPEQARNLPIDHRCDLFSLAVCLYESLSGERLFVGDLTTPAEAIYGHAILPLSQKRAGIPAALDAVLARALAPELADRYATAAEFADALRTVAHHSGIAFSAPELADHLQEILGSDASRWLRDEPAPELASAEPPKVPAASVGLVGKEAASIGLVNETRDDEAALAMLGAKSVTGGKDFDLDSMLNDEAPQGGRERAKPAPPDLEVTTTWEGRRDPPSGGAEAPPNKKDAKKVTQKAGEGDPSTDTTRPRAKTPTPLQPPPGLKPGESLSERLAPRPSTPRRTGATGGRATETPPPVWTRDSGPVSIASGSPAPRSRVETPRLPAGGSFPGNPSPGPTPAGARPPPAPPVPPAAAPTPAAPSRTPLAVPAAPPPADLSFRRTGGRTLRGPAGRGPSPAPPPFIPVSPVGGASTPGTASPAPIVFGPGTSGSSLGRTGGAGSASSPPPPPPMPPTPVAGFGRRDEPTSEFEEPTPGQVPPGYAAAASRTPPLLALGPPDVDADLARLDAAGRGQPLQPFPLDAELSSPFSSPVERAPLGRPHAERLPAMPDLPPTTDFTVDLSSNASGRSGRASGPPLWLAICGLAVALGGGAVLGARVTTTELGSVLSTVAELEQRAGRLTAADAARAALPRTDDGQPLPPAAEAEPVAAQPPTGSPAAERQGEHGDRADRTVPGDAARAVEGSAADGSEGHASPSSAKHAHPGGGSSAGSKKGGHAGPRPSKSR
jgi:serine/threonine protein kinase